MVDSCRAEGTQEEPYKVYGKACTGWMAFLRAPRLNVANLAHSIKDDPQIVEDKVLWPESPASTQSDICADQLRITGIPFHSLPAHQPRSILRVDRFWITRRHSVSAGNTLR